MPKRSSLCAGSRRHATLALVYLLVAGCGVTTWSPSIYEPGSVPANEEPDYLKVHTHSGELFVLFTWDEPAANGSLEGSGARYDLDRRRVEQSRFTIPGADIALLEASSREVVSKFAMTGLSVFTGLYGLVTVTCLADPKSCFGSCPTFYTIDDPDRPIAEGFSSSFARVLEARDVDGPGLRAFPS